MLPGGFGRGGIGIGLSKAVAQFAGGLLGLALAVFDGLAVAGDGQGLVLGPGDDGIECVCAGCGVVEQIGALARIYFGAGRGDGLVDGAGFRRCSIESTFWPSLFAQSST